MTGRPLLLGPLSIAAILCIVASAYWQTFFNMAVLRGTDGQALIFPAFFWIVWELRSELSTLPIRGSWLGLAGLAGAGLAWLVGEMIFMRVLTDFALIAMIWMAILSVLGYRWLSTLIFPLSFLLFAIPIWDPLVPTLVNWTAKFTFLALQASGIPVYREGAYFVVPSGNWSIADACSGIRYLSTCLMLGVLYAWTMYGSLRKRAIFMAGVIVIGVVGNWVRAYLTIAIAHLSDNRFLRDGHGTFGWILFAVLLFGYCWLGWTFRDKETVETDADQTARGAGQHPLRFEAQSSGLRTLAACAGMLIVLVAWPLAKTATAPNQQFRAAEVVDIAPQGGWSRVDRSSVEWTPELQNPSRVRVQSFRKGGLHVDVFIGMFQNQTWTSKLVTSVNQFADSDNPAWSQINRGRAVTEFAGGPLEVKTGVVLGRGARVVAWQWYWIDGASIGGDVRAKFQQMLVRFQGKDDISAWIAIFARGDTSADLATKSLEEFMRDMGGSLERALRATTPRG